MVRRDESLTRPTKGALFGLSRVWVGQITHPARDREGEESQGKDRTDRRKTEWKR